MGHILLLEKYVSFVKNKEIEVIVHTEDFDWKLILA